MQAIVIAILQSKGGCTKTTTAVNLAGALNELCVNTILVDWDLNKPDAIKWKSQGDFIDWIVPINKENPSAAIENLKKKYDIIICDTPPNFERGSFEAAVCADYVIIPSSANFLEQDNTKDAIQIPLLAQKPFKILINKVKNATKAGKEIRKDVDTMKDINFKEIITDRDVVAQCPRYGKWIGQFAKGSVSHKQYLAVANEVLSWIGYKHESIKLSLEEEIA